MLLFLLSLAVSSAVAQFDAVSCSQSKGCLFSPPNCQPLTGNCRISFSYLVVGDVLQMELSGIVNGDGYIATGFSTDQRMGDDTVVWCGMLQGQTLVGLSYNNGRSNEPIDENGIQTINRTSASNGNVYCSFSQKLNPNRRNVKRLDSEYFPLMATGPLQAGPRLQFHEQNRFVLPRTDFRAYRSVDGQVQVIGGGVSPLNDEGAKRSNADKLKIAHAILMVLSFGVFMATGILFARHFRNHWPETILCGLKMWFHMHRTLNMIGIAGSICGFVMIFVANDWKWTGPKAYASNEENRGWGSIHSILGLLACVIAWAQPLNAVFRCDPHHKARFIFNWIHRFFGTSAFVLALSAVMIACVHFTPMFSNRDAALGIWIAYVCVVGVTLILLEVLSIKSWWTIRKRIGPEMEMTRLGSTSVVVYEDISRMQNVQAAIMCLFIICGAGLCIALCVLIGLKPVVSV